MLVICVPRLSEIKGNLTLEQKQLIRKTCKIAAATCFAVLTPKLAIAGELGVLAGLNGKAQILWNQFKFLGKMALLIKGLSDIIQNGVAGDLEGVKQSFIKYTLIYLCILLYPSALDMVDEMFQ